jgi:YjbE family integral membrane protein
MFDVIALPFAKAAWAGPVIAFAQVVMIDLVLASDNAVAVGMAAAGLPDKDRKKAIVLGLGGAVIMLIGLALGVQTLLKVVGLLLGGGILLLWVCWKMWRDLREHAEQVDGEATLEGNGPAVSKKPKTLTSALITILLADISMSLDNVLAVAGAARGHPYVMAFGLVLSVTMMGVAATWIAKLMMRWRWLGYVGLAIVMFVAVKMIWDGHREVVERTGKTAAYNAIMPDPLDIKGPKPAQ